MLTGRESLIRLIGKRRRFLPSRQSLFSNPEPISLNLSNDNDGDVCSGKFAEQPQEANLNQFKYVGDETENKTPHVEIACPVCGCKIDGDNYEVNSHLDVCLSQRTKRKLTQRTLLQLNFSPTLKVQNIPADSLKSENAVVLRNCNNHVPHNLSNVLPGLTAKEESEKKCKLTHNPDHNHNGCCKIGSSSLSSKDGLPKLELANCRSSLSGATLETFLVGRRYTGHEEIHPGDTFSLVRDPHNVNDSNAIKVVSADSGSSKLLGFLSRELAQYLSPLVDNYGLIFEGHISSVPEHSVDAVPIQIVCQRESDFERGLDDETFKCLWENAQHVVEIRRNDPPSVKYQLNFCLILKEVLRSNFHLLTDDEKEYLELFTLLSNDSQRLFIRLYTRKGPWFRMSCISYTEIIDVQKAAKGLADKGYVCYVEDGDHVCESEMKDILNTLTVSELREIWCLLEKSCNRGLRKQDLVASLLSSYADGLWPFLSTEILNRTGTCIKIASKAETLMWRAERLFFLNGEQDLSTFLLVDMGKVKYPTYSCITSEPIFSNRSDLLLYEEAIEVAQIMDEALDTHDNELVLKCIKIAESHVSTVLPIQYSTAESVVSFRCLYTASWVHSKVVTLGISFLEQLRRYSDAIGLLKQLLSFFTHDVRRGYWTLRLSVDLEHLGYIDESLQVAENGLLDPWIRAGSRVALQRRVLRLGRPPRRWKVPSFSKSINREITEVYVQGRPLNSELGAKNRFYNEEGEQCGVEQLALHYYVEMEGGWQGVHTESGIWLTIFGLLMWHIIFADVPNVFYNRFQIAPFDLVTDGFYTARKSIIESHLRQIHDGMAEEFLIKSWETHYGTRCRGVNWDCHSLDELRAAVACVGGPCLASLCRLFAQDYQSWSSGMPDLLLWRFHGEYSGEAKLVEVKGPKDRLSEQQRAWLLQLMDCGFKVEVCKVKP
ncbi:fanconi-associated nuclease 1 homolog isoform X2 [Neltuma alba]|uniref:fanconi-associated nuclease 1 homolog isoform X2 n=1 Tax=Neltuma alba TaxID=207710 RepID=UPI0010A2C46B|nr:fanconi-associated nuclease 1 homolog isoform X2 [Prosopis alba]